MAVRLSSPSALGIVPPMEEGRTVANVGRPSLRKDQADRVIAAMRELLRQRFDGNKTALASALGRSQPTVSNLLHPSGAKDRPSYETAERVARLLGMPVSDLLGGSPEEGDILEHRPNLEAALHQLGTMVRPGARSTVLRVAAALPDLATSTWIVLLMDEAHGHESSVPRSGHRPKGARAADVRESPPTKKT